MKRSTDSKWVLPPPPALRAGARWWVAYSGGLDSTVLLHLAAQARLPGLTAVHVHHGLQDVADAWVEHCRAACAALKVPFQVLRVAVDTGAGEGPEAAARSVRYAALRALLAPGDGLATAHHRDDQAETVLLRALRGCGIDGLGAMRAVGEFPPGLLWRPLLEQPRAALRAYAVAQGLRFVEDPHNADPRFARVHLRQAVLPALAAHWPQAGASLARLARQAQDAADLLRELALQDLAALAPEGAPASSLPVGALRALSVARRHNAVRAWLAARGLPAPYEQTLESLDREVLAARPDADPLLAWPGGEMRRYRDRLYAMAPLAPPPDPAVRLNWQAESTLELPPDCGRLHGSPPPGGLSVRFDPAGRRLKPACGGPTRTLKNLFQERGVPPWVRARTPLIYQGETLRCVADYWCDPQWAGGSTALRWETGLAGADNRGAG